ncbi:MAG TPA: hypothetical protein VF800_01280 [Telluria sp.]
MPNNPVTALPDVAPADTAAGNSAQRERHPDNLQGAHALATAGGWAEDWFALPGAAVFDHGTQRIAAVARAPGILDLFVIGFDNRVWTTFWTEQTGWNADWFPLPGGARFDHERQQVVALSRAPGILDLFVIGFDNHVWSTYWTESSGWSSEWFPIPGATVFDHTRQQVAAVARAPDILDLFVVGFDNRVWSTFWTGTTGWNRDWFPLPGGARFDGNTQQVTALARERGNLDLFIIGSDGHIWSTYWSEATGWNSDWFQVPGATTFDHATQRVAAVARAPGILDLFVIGVDNRVWSTYWTEASGWNREWFALPGGARFNHRTQQVTALARAPGNLDLFLIGGDNRVWSTFWSDATGWSGDWFRLPGATTFDHTRQHIAALARTSGILDLFALGSDNRARSTYWTAG